MTTDGRRIGRVGPAIGLIRGIEQVQIEQSEVGRLIVRVTLTSSESASIEALELSLRGLLADPATVLEMRPGEPPVAGPGGKVRAVVSHLKPQLV